MSSVVADEPLPSGSVQNGRVPVRQATWTRSRNASSAVATSNAVHAGTPAQTVHYSTQPQFAEQAVQPFVGQPHAHNVVAADDPSVQYGFADRMQYAMTGGPVAESVESVGEWWQERAQRMVDNRQVGKRPPLGQRMANSQNTVLEKSKQFVEGITYDQGEFPVNDFYEERPITVTSSSFQEAPQQQDEASAQMVSYHQDSERGGDRLKTDIRSIKPTLSYAMKNINRKDLPQDFDGELDAGEYVPRQSAATVLQWAPTNLYHYPLYFEDPSLERYGHTYHPLVQPFASTGRFAVQVAGLPYQMALKPAHSREYDLGYYRPGECAPKKHYQIPFNEEATLVEIATIAGLILIIP
jgi:hypothetical protein